VRLRIELERIGDAVLDLNYNYNLASLIYRRIQKSDGSLSLNLHEKKGFKFFTFSKLMVPKRMFKIVDNHMVIVSRDVYFYFSTPVDEIAKALVEGLLSEPNVEICGAKFTISEISVIKERNIGKKERFVTLSPINVSTTKEGKVRDLYPDNPDFYKNLKLNLINKYLCLFKKEPKEYDLEITPIRTKPKRIKVKNTFHRCVEMVFDAKGSRELLEIGYKAGFGERNSMGFGMVKVV